MSINQQIDGGAGETGGQEEDKKPIGRMPTLDSSSESPTSDPNCSEFGFDSLRGLIEKSDFLLNECNTHLDVYTIPDDIHDE
ncbi:hypothetical protein L6452_22502 [Arctium lappa]|uniref:Uncharacterized protein n=1 Tax=Arctium lappa TaxID=4217 RepID=A0ACB9B1Q2_ARCLA|nr:hypothetical protein L6452_22502 [Arctium lappa]